MRQPYEMLSTYEKQRRVYFAMFARSHVCAFKPHWKKGETLGKGPQVWRNVSEHCLVEGVLADVLAEELGLSKEERSDAVTAALLHDWSKKLEVEAAEQARGAGLSDLDAYVTGKKSEGTVLKELGFPARTQKIIDAIIPKTRRGPQTMPEKVMWYVDAVLSNTEPVRLKERFDNMERGWDGIRENPARGVRNRAFSDSFKPCYQGMSLYQVQREIADRLEPEFAFRIGYKGFSTDLPLFLRQKIDDRINSVALRR
jgi:hypothetical protein